MIEWIVNGFSDRLMWQAFVTAVVILAVWVLCLLWRE